MGALKEIKEKRGVKKVAEIKDLEGYKRWRKLRDEQNERVDNYVPINRKLSDNYEPIDRIFHDQCPCCNTKLKSKVVKETDSTKYVIRSCPFCGYEYAD
ncbi:MAG: hypothetical protein PH343_07045 [Nitrospira sp.]|nr:hypothetical protein [Nitrospira sp.]